MEINGEILSALYEAVSETNLLLPENQQLTKDPDAALFGPDSALDSIGLVSFIIEAESTLSQALGKAITLADERALSQSHSPFRTLGTLVQYVEEQTANGCYKDPRAS